MMKVLLILGIFAVLSGCVTHGISKEHCEKYCKAPIKETNFKGVSISRIGDQQVVLVGRLKRTEIIKASTKGSTAEIVRISTARVPINKGKLKIDFPIDAEGDVYAGEQTEDSIYVIRQADEETVVVCGETQNPCSVDDAQGTHGCSGEFGQPNSDDPLDQYFTENGEAIQAFCQGSDGGGTI